MMLLESKKAPQPVKASGTFLYAMSMLEFSVKYAAAMILLTQKPQKKLLNVCWHDNCDYLCDVI